MILIVSSCGNLGIDLKLEAERSKYRLVLTRLFDCYCVPHLPHHFVPIVFS